MQILINKGFARFAKKNNIDNDNMIKAIDEVASGLIDADLGGGLIKKRLARSGEGKRGGYRTIIAYQRGTRAFFLYGFPKNKMDNIEDRDLADLRSLARVYASLNEDEISKAIGKGVFVEVDNNGKKIQE